LRIISLSFGDYSFTVKGGTVVNTGEGVCEAVRPGKSGTSTWSLAFTTVLGLMEPFAVANKMAVTDRSGTGSLVGGKSGENRTF
jgi:hypothetical protein